MSRLVSLSSALELKAEEAHAAYLVAETECAQRQEAETRMARTAEESAVWEQLAREEEQERLRLTAAFKEKLKQIQSDAAARTTAESEAIAVGIAAPRPASAGMIRPDACHLLRRTLHLQASIAFRCSS